MKKRATDDLRMELMAQPDLQSFLRDHREEFVDRDMAAALRALFARKQISKSALAEAAQMSEVYLHQVFSGKRRLSRDRLLCVCISLKADVEETQALLKASGMAPLYARDRRDAVVLYGLDKSWDLEAVQNQLAAASEPPLGRNTRSE